MGSTLKSVEEGKLLLLLLAALGKANMSQYKRAFICYSIYLILLLQCVTLASPQKGANAKQQKVEVPKTGRILFYMPLVSKSMKITFMPLAEELASRGHEVVVVMPHEAKSKYDKLDILTINSPFDGKQSLH